MISSPKKTTLLASLLVSLTATQASALTTRQQQANQVRKAVILSPVAIYAGLGLGCLVSRMGGWRALSPVTLARQANARMARFVQWSTACNSIKMAQEAREDIAQMTRQANQLTAYAAKARRAQERQTALMHNLQTAQAAAAQYGAPGSSELLSKAIANARTAVLEHAEANKALLSMHTQTDVPRWEELASRLRSKVATKQAFARHHLGLARTVANGKWVRNGSDFLKTEADFSIIEKPAA